MKSAGPPWYLLLPQIKGQVGLLHLCSKCRWLQNERQYTQTDSDTRTHTQWHNNALLIQPTTHLKLPEPIMKADLRSASREHSQHLCQQIIMFFLPSCISSSCDASMTVETVAFVILSHIFLLLFLLHKGYVCSWGGESALTGAKILTSTATLWMMWCVIQNAQW